MKLLVCPKCGYETEGKQALSLLNVRKGPNAGNYCILCCVSNLIKDIPKMVEKEVPDQ